MKKRVLCLLLTFLMLASSICFTSCSSEEDALKELEQNQQSTKKSYAMTLTLWGIKEEGTTDEAVELVEKAMSDITKSEFNTNLELNLFTKDEYKAAIEARMNEAAEQLAIKEAEEEEKAALEMLQGGADDDEETEETIPEDVTSINELGLVETIYPESDPGQLDIFYIPDYDTYVEYIENEHLSLLDEELSTTGKLMKTYIHPNILNATKVDGLTYAVLNNKAVGTYTYLLLNKDLLDKYYYDSDEITQFAMADEFIMDIAANEPGIVPVYSDFEPIGVHYFTEENERSIVGNVQAATAIKDERAYAPPRVIFTSNDYTKHIKQIKKYESYGYIGDGTAEIGDFGVAVISGSVADVEKYADDYVIHVLQKPYITNEIYNDMFAISAYTKDLTRSMEVLTALNTNSELRNIFAYGIEGTHFQLDADGVVQKLNDDYNVPLNATGNTFITYPPEGSYADIWEDCKAQNLELNDHPYLGFVYEDQLNDDNRERAMELKAKVEQLSIKYFNELDNVPYAEIDNWINRVNEELKNDPDVSEYVAFDKAVSLAFQYNEWFFALFPDAMA